MMLLDEYKTHRASCKRLQQDKRVSGLSCLHLLLFFELQIAYSGRHYIYYGQVS